jgi:hypothetical protein
MSPQEKLKVLMLRKVNLGAETLTDLMYTVKKVENMQID